MEPPPAPVSAETSTSSAAGTAGVSSPSDCGTCVSFLSVFFENCHGIEGSARCGHRGVG